ncbi:hypothetical protein [Kitasatospora purpeofusca]|uniref:hypothetical protein n=1 Tax=Kitasatospora purpeofusca TaxID=67352 RepID=UPI002E27DCA3|nr:hypothetical protein [Kitasatospora purpeofusca]
MPEEQAARGFEVLGVEELPDCTDELLPVSGASAGGPVVEPVASVAGPRVEVPSWRDGLGVEVLPPECARVVALVERDAAGGGEGVRAMREHLGWPASDAKEQAARFRAKRLVERGWLTEARPGLFRPRTA